MRCSECVYGVRTGAELFCAEYDFLVECEDANGCESYEPIRNPRTNADRIRAMTDAELADWVADISTAPNCTGKCHKDYEVYGELRTFCHDCWLDWMKLEAEK